MSEIFICKNACLISEGERVEVVFNNNNITIIWFDKNENKFRVNSISQENLEKFFCTQKEYRKLKLLQLQK